MSIGKNILKLLGEKQKSQSWLSRELKISRSRVNNWVKDRNIPTLDDQKEICRILEVDMNTLTGVVRKSIGTTINQDEKDLIIAQQAEEIKTLKKVLKGLL